MTVVLTFLSAGYLLGVHDLKYFCWLVLAAAVVRSFGWLVEVTEK